MASNKGTLNKSFIEMGKDFVDQQKDMTLNEISVDNKPIVESNIECPTDNSEEKPKRFNKDVCIKNLRYLIKEQKIKIGSIEEAVGVSPGYLARLEREDNNTNPSIEFVAEASKMLNVSIDDLIDKDMTSMSQNEQYIYRFIEKMIKDTKNNKLYWNKESKTELTKCVGRDEKAVVHPLFRPTWKLNENDDYRVYPKYFSQFYPDDDWEVWEYFYKTNITGGTIYITNVHNFQNVKFTCELYFVKKYGGVNKLSHYVFEEDNPLGDITWSLYKAAEFASNNANLNSDVIDAIDAFMGDEKKKEKIEKEEKEMGEASMESTEFHVITPDDLPFY